MLIDDGGITGPTFFEHVRRLRRPVLNSPKGQTAPVLAVIDALAGDTGPLGLDDDAWLPVGDPHREAAR